MTDDPGPSPPCPERFDLIEEISASESELVYRAHDRELNREVFLKWLSPGASLTIGGGSKSLREARALAKLSHPGVVRLFDVIQTDHGPLLVMDPIAGEPLGEKLSREGRLSAEETRKLGIAICRALGAVHAAGIVHRGLSGENIILKPDGSTCLTGFSFAKPGGHGLGMSSIDYRSSGASEGGRALPVHVSPEQLQGQTADARSDLFGVGCVLYECLTGQSAFADGNVSNPPADPSSLVPGVPKALGEAILICLAKSPTRRPPTAVALEQLLEAAEAGETPAPPPVSRRLFVLLAASLLVLLGSGYFFLMSGNAVKGGAPDETSRGRSPVRRDSPTGLKHAFRSSRALLIGIGYEENHDWQKLCNAEKDIEDLAVALKQLPGDWKVKKLCGARATKKRIQAELNTLLDEAEVDDRVFIYYAGHGVRKGDVSAWLLPVDAEAERKDISLDRWIAFGELERFLREIDAKHVMLALDCCYSGKLAENMRSASTFERKNITRRARVIFASGRGTQEVRDGDPGENSPYARTLLEALRDRSQEFITAT
ncbi:MAG: protein kinase, partial [Planctomycetota bacterium]